MIRAALIFKRITDCGVKIDLGVGVARIFPGLVSALGSR